MLPLRTVVCPVRLVPASGGHVRLARDLCRAFGARLVVHHNLVELAIGSGVGWMWAADHPETRETENEASARLSALIAGLEGDVPVEGRLTHGPLVQTIRAVADSVDADLVVMSTRGAAAREDEDGSVTERVLARSARAVLAVHDDQADDRRLDFSSRGTAPQTLLAAADLTPRLADVLATAAELTERFRWNLHILHVLPGRRPEAVLNETKRKLAAALPAGLSTTPSFHVDFGDPARAIAACAERIGANCVLMGEHPPTPLRHWFRPDAPRGVLHLAGCPVWYVPERSGSASHPDAPAPGSDASVAPLY